MFIDWNQFTPWSALIGGAIIGLAAALLILFNGRIAGISGIVGGMLTADRGDVGWRIAFVSGLVAAPLVWQFFRELPLIRIDASYAVLAAAGLIVGIGTRYGSGCTSGHGVCGISRGSPRSVAATLIFMGVGMLTVYLIRHVFQS
ncbi:MAG: YeeE/YedE [Nitrosomonadales bacterium SCN 54-20]|nr:MAG: YeeE/YedE [Nitrosomonadales bacterium SCN 54-20]